MIVLVDNYDSFTWNLVQMPAFQQEEIRVIRNDEMTPQAILALEPEAIVLSPGPGRPEEAGCLIPLIQLAAGQVPILGICLGHQAIAQAFGARVGYARKLMHGKQDRILPVQEDPLFAGLEKGFAAGRYHSLAVLEQDLPDCLQVLAYSPDHEIMALRYADCPVYGLQFHPESILTPQGSQLLSRFIAITRNRAPQAPKGDLA